MESQRTEGNELCGYCVFLLSGDNKHSGRLWSACGTKFRGYRVTSSGMGISWVLSADLGAEQTGKHLQNPGCRGTSSWRPQWNRSRRWAQRAGGMRWTPGPRKVQVQTVTTNCSCCEVTLMLARCCQTSRRVYSLNVEESLTWLEKLHRHAWICYTHLALVMTCWSMESWLEQENILQSLVFLLRNFRIKFFCFGCLIISI